MSKTIVYYHANCADGFGAAYAAHQYFGDAADYIPWLAGVDLELDHLTNAEVYCLDFCPPNLEYVLAFADKVWVIDHHDKAKAIVAKIQNDGTTVRDLTFKFSEENSGCIATWKHFFPEDDPPLFLTYVEDRDLWKWDLNDSREINAYILSQPMTFDDWRELEDDIDYGKWSLEDCVSKGEAILRCRQQLVDQICQGAYEAVLFGHTVLVANTPVLQSEVGAELAKSALFGATWHITKDGKYRWSLRSDGSINVADLAATFVGGGGHPNAAGFATDIDITQGMETVTA